MNVQARTELDLKPLHDLLEYRFVVPSYQRGYRWTTRQVTELLDDLLEFQRASGGKEGSFYCLQPVVVRPAGDGAWELIDGQQRLTTIRLILSELRMVVEFLELEPFEISYVTRPHSARFLQDPESADPQSNIDFFHMDAARTAIREWFAAHPKTLKVDLVRCLLAPRDGNVKVIWYKLPAEQDPIDVFVRLNVGKIPLTNAELIRALFLRSGNFELGSAPSQVQIAHEWDAIEKRLQDDALWYFIHPEPETYATRIEYLFEILVRKRGKDLPRGDAYGIFAAFSDHFRQPVMDASGIARPATLDFRWGEVKRIALRLEEWFSDRELYHLVGFWLRYVTGSAKSARRSSEVVVELLQERLTSSRSAFVRALKRRILERLLPGSEEDDLRERIRAHLDDLSYGGTSGNHRLRSTLLLFNIATLLQNSSSTLRFPFDLFHLEQWDIEHVRSVTDERPLRPDDQKAWLETVHRYWTSTPPATEAQAASWRMVQDLLDDFATGRFERVYQHVLEGFGEGGSTDADNSLGNLVLLDASTNRAYKNATFPVKRRHVLDLDKRGTFVPLCTTNVFLKYYTRGPSGVSWTDDDAKDYVDAVESTLVHLFEGGDV